MTNVLDGTYAIATIGVAGMSVAVAEIRNNKVSANDIAGSRYSGTVMLSSDGMVAVDLQMASPPNTFGVWGTSATETIQVRTISEKVPLSAFEGVGFTLPGYELQVFLRRISDDYASLAGPNGIQQVIDNLVSAQRAWNGD